MPENFFKEAEINGDGKIGPEEAVCIPQMVAGVRGNGIAIGGEAIAPGGLLAGLQQNFKLRDLLFPSAHAAGIGLEPVAGATVELIEVHANGNQVGPVLADSATSITGHYNLTVPRGINLSAKLVVRITGDTQMMRAQVVAEHVTIDPISEYVLQRLTSDGNSLDNVAANEVLVLRGYAEAFDYVAAEGLDSTIQNIYNEIKSCSYQRAEFSLFP